MRKLNLRNFLKLERLDQQSWNIDISPNGDGLPEVEGTVNLGAQVYAKQCAVCHGEDGCRGNRESVSGGQGSLVSKHPVKTVGSYWPYATTLYDYIY